MNLNRFPIFMINLERLTELVTLTNKIANDFEIKSQLTKGKNDLNSINSKEELLEAIRNQEFRLFPDEAAVLNKIMQESILKEKQLAEEVDALYAKLDNLKGDQNEFIEKTKNLKENSKNVKASNDPNYFIRIIDEVRDLFKEELRNSEIEIKDLNTKVTKFFDF